MHINDGPLSPQVCLVTGALSVAAVGYSLRRLESSVADKTVPLTGMMAALIFAGQMVNFPLIGTSGHLMGGVLAAAVLGPWAGCLALTLVLIVQCLMFGDGGILSLGANTLHMGVVGSLGGYAIMACIRRGLGNSPRSILIGSIVAAWISVMAAACLFCLEFRLSHSAESFEFSRIFAVMVTVHSGIGVVEALITGLIVNLLLTHRPDLIYENPQSSPAQRTARVVVAGAVCALAAAAFLSPFASSLPDGLEAVAKSFRFDELEAESTASLFSDYEVASTFWNWKGLSVSLAGILGTTTVLVIAAVFARVMNIENVGRTLSPSNEETD
ncbi:MAG: cobalt ABC transporter permease [Planctomycetaceae bacterium]|nr:cobalt ABC transporter permease [Planctomycetaceae bacterium]